MAVPGHRPSLGMGTGQHGPPLSILPLGYGRAFDHFFFSGGERLRPMSPVLQPPLYGQGAPTSQPQQRLSKKFCSQTTTGDACRGHLEMWQPRLTKVSLIPLQWEVARVVADRRASASQLVLHCSQATCCFCLSPTRNNEVTDVMSRAGSATGGLCRGVLDSSPHVASERRR